MKTQHAGKLKKIGTRILILLLTSCFSIFTSASAKEANENQFSYLKFTGGLLTAYAVHEAAHIIAGAATNTNMSWAPGTYNQPIGFNERAESNERGLIINASGLLAQTAASETILRMDGIDKNSDFIRGVMTWNILNPIIYALDYWLIGKSNIEKGESYQGDLKGTEHYADEPTANAYAAAIAAITLSQTARYIKTQEWAKKWMKSERHNVTPTLLTEGIGIAYKYDF